MKVTTFTVLPDTPPELKNLVDLAYNLYFSWNPDAMELFKNMDPELWEASQFNPVRLLCMIPQEKLETLAKDQAFLVELASVYDRFTNYLEGTTWFERQYERHEKPIMAYFSAEFGLNSCLPIYSGGLGVLSGDHIKSSSDLGLPLVGVGLLYRQGYFCQHLNVDGLQQEIYIENDWYSMPVHLIKDAQGKPLQAEVILSGDRVFFQIWRVDVGRVSIYLLDTNLIENQPKYRDITKNLYDSDREVRLWQEIILGIGGVRALRLLGFNPKVYHVNEGHSAFLLLERIRQLREELHLNFDEAKQIVWSSTLFTTHTPVPAGNERFRNDLVKQYFDVYVKELGISWKEFMALGRQRPDDEREDFCMTILAIKLCAHCNGVSKLHGEISRNMWKSLFPNIPVEEIPIGAVVNGVHAATWMNLDLYNLFLRYGGLGSASELSAFHIWSQVDKIKDSDLWDICEQNRIKLVDYVRDRLRIQFRRHGYSTGELRRVEDILDPRALTIGFARRFASYKRAHLLFRNVTRLKKILCDPVKPVQIILAGKAHPADQRGKDIIKMIYEATKDPDLRRRVVFVENFNLDVAQQMISGVDVWLNTPCRPMEASGTSGMKAAMNGGLNLSILDGWWDEAYTPEVGWPIGKGELYDNIELQDQIESDQLYGVLEREVVPLFYERNSHARPLGWIQMMKNSIKELGTNFNSHRMLNNYLERYYMPAKDMQERLSEGGAQQARELSSWLKHIREKWDGLQIERVESSSSETIYKGSKIEVMGWIHLNEINPENIQVECYHGPLDNDYKITDPRKIEMKLQKMEGQTGLFRTQITCNHGGRYGYTVRVLPGHKNLAVNYLPGLMKWHEDM